MPRTLKAPPPAVAKRSRTEWDEFIRRRERLNEDRKRLDRESEFLAKEVAAMDGELVALVDAETSESSRCLQLKHFMLTVEWAPVSAMATAFAVLRAFTTEKGREAVDAIRDRLERKRRLEITWKTDPAHDAAAA